MDHTLRGDCHNETYSEESGITEHTLRGTAIMEHTLRETAIMEHTLRSLVLWNPLRATLRGTAILP